MPFHVVPSGDKFNVENANSGDVKNDEPFASRAKAEAYARALNANSETSKRSKMDKLKVAEIHKHAAHIMEHTSTMMEEAETLEEDATETPEDEAAGKSLNLSYVKSLGITVPDMAVKYVALDEIKGYTFLWGNPSLTDIEHDYFTKSTNFWDEVLGKSPRPLTWDHAQDDTLKASPIIGSIHDFGDDEVGRWYVAKLDRSHRYRKAVDALIKEGKLGTSSDSAPQYVQRVKTGKSTWLKSWAWFASALTDTPAEPRMIDSLEYLKSIGVVLPDTRLTAWKYTQMQREFLELKYKQE